MVYHSFPISVLSSNKDAVTFSVSQEWTNDCSIKRISTIYKISQLDERCDSTADVIPHEKFIYTAFCVDNVAAVSVFVHNHSLDGTLTALVPPICMQDIEKGAIAPAIQYDFSIPCGCDIDNSPPTSVFDTCTPKVVSFNQKELGVGAYVSQQLIDDGIKLTGQVRSSDSGGTPSIGLVRVFDTSRPTNGTGYGNPELAGPFGNVLVIQESGLSDQWKASQQGGTMIFDLSFPMDVFELSVLNAGTNINVLATSTSGSSHSFSIPGATSTEKKDLVMDVSDVTRIIVSSNGPFAVVHLGVCDVSKSIPPSPSPADLCVIGIQHDSSKNASLFQGLPIAVEESDKDTVTFTVSQTWLDHCSVKWLATHYHSTESDMRCDVEHDVVPDQSFKYTAACVDGFAKVAIYVDDSGLNATDTAIVPDLCPVEQDNSRSVAHTFTIPCGCPQHAAVAGSVASDSTCDLFDLSFDDKNIPAGSYVSLQWTDHNVKFSGTEREKGSGGFMPEGHLRLFDTGAAVDSKGYGTANLQGTDGKVLVIQENDRSQWKANEAGGVVTIAFLSPVAELAEIGLLNVVKDVQVRVTASDNSLSHFLITAAGAGSKKAVVIDKMDVLKVELTFFGPVAISHVTLCETRHTHAPSLAPQGSPSSSQRQKNQVACNRDLFEDYETEGQSDSWENGSEYDDPVFTTFLGRLGREHPQVSKVFTVPPNADSIDLNFDIYDIDGTPGDDRVLVGIQGSFVDLNLFASDGSKKYYNDIEVTGSVTSTRRISFKYDYDTIYSVSMRVPKYWYKDYNFKLPISFKVVTKKTISSESYGIDNLRIHANCMRRELQDAAPAAEPDEHGDDSGFYCSSNDFPCEGGNGMVYVCHYSARKGYETFCVPEPDSEILRFYSNDYCGPCVGGFGIHQQNLAR
jgi:hypothetical protein